jgi:hypothetical protein
VLTAEHEERIGSRQQRGEDREQTAESFPGENCPPLMFNESRAQTGERARLVPHVLANFSLAAQGGIGFCNPSGPNPLSWPKPL